MFSVTKTGTWTRPLWTAIVRPTNSGGIEHERAHVFIIVRSSLPSAASFFASFGSINGPFFSDLLILLPYFLLASWRLRTINLVVVLRRRVLYPKVFWPHGVRGAAP